MGLKITEYKTVITTKYNTEEKYFAIKQSAINYINNMKQILKNITTIEIFEITKEVIHYEKGTNNSSSY